MKVMRPMRLDELFDVKNGVASVGLEVLDKPERGSVPYIRPSSSQRHTVAGWVYRKSVGEKNIYPSGTLFVSTDGEGSHTYSYVSQFEFVPNSNVAVLIPKEKMGVAEKVFFASCITINRYRFSYGRKPKGDRLKSIELPDKAPSWVNSECARSGIEILASRIPSIAVTVVPKLGDGLQRIGDLFEMRYGPSLELVRLKRDPDGVNFVSRTSQNNGVSARVALVYGVDPDPAGTLSVALGGSVLETFLQAEPWYSGRDMGVLIPRRLMSDAEKLWWASCIRANRYRYSYGRQANRTLVDLMIPIKVPEWVGTAPHKAAKDLRNGVIEVANSIANTESENFTNLASKLFKVPKG